MQFNRTRDGRREGDDNPPLPWYHPRFKFGYDKLLTQLLGSQERLYPFLRHAKDNPKRGSTNPAKFYPSMRETIHTDGPTLAYIVDDVIGVSLVMRFITTTDDRLSLLSRLSNAHKNKDGVHAEFHQGRAMYFQHSPLGSVDDIPLIDDNPRNWERTNLLGSPTTVRPAYHKVPRDTKSGGPKMKSPPKGTGERAKSAAENGDPRVKVTIGCHGSRLQLQKPYGVTKTRVGRHFGGRTAAVRWRTGPTSLTWNTRKDCKLFLTPGLMGQPLTDHRTLFQVKHLKKSESVGAILRTQHCLIRAISISQVESARGRVLLIPKVFALARFFKLQTGI